MNIKRAKEEIKDTIEAYLLKDENGEYVIPSIRQRPVLLIDQPLDMLCQHDGFLPAAMLCPLQCLRQIQ